MKGFKLLQGTTSYTSKWCSTDSKQVFEENLRTQPADWIWSSKRINYIQNKQRYRAPRWSLCDWNNSILIFGCSIVFGVGVDNEDTISNQLSKLLKVPVINLGQPGTGINFLWANTILLNSYGIRPKACIYIWPDISRQTEFLSNYNYNTHGIWELESKFDHLVLNEEHNQSYYKYKIQNIKLLWECPVLEATYYANISQMFNCEKILDLDRARDLGHPGPKSNRNTAQRLAERLILNGFS